MKGNFAVIGMLLKIPTLLIFCALYSISANAAPVVWNLSGVTFEDGGTASGSFTYDADTTTYSAISISTTAGSVITTAMDYDVTNASCLALNEIVCFLNVADGPDYTDDLGVTFAWVGTPLTNAGGTVALTGAREYHCLIPDCSTVDLAAPLRLLATGSITSDLTTTYSVGGTVSGLTGTGLALQNNGGDTLAVAAAATAFTFATELPDLATYAVTVSTQPTGQICSVTNGSGTIATADVADVGVACVDDVVPPVDPPAPAIPIPTLSQWALIMLSMLLGLMVFSNRKRLF
jgi:hypothetical protein